MHRNVVQFSSRKTNNSISTQMNETEKYDEKQIINKRKSFCTQNAKLTEYQIGNATQAQWGQIYLFLRAFAAIRSQTPAPPPRILLLSWCNFISFLFISIFSSKQTGSTAKPSVVFCVCLDKLRKQIHWKTIQNSVSKLNNSQLICNKTAVAISDVLVLLAHRTQRQHSRPLKRPASGQQKN